MMMLKLVAACKKEIQLLIRDKAGLAMLFIMPMALVLIITLIQNNILETSNQPKMTLAVINLDEGELGNTLYQSLKSTGFFEFTETYEGKLLTEEMMRERIAKGDFQAGIIIPENASKIQLDKVIAMMEKRKWETQQHTVSLLFDPSIQHAMRLSVVSMVHRILQTEKIKSLLVELQFTLEDVLPPEEDDSGANIWQAADQVLEQDTGDIDDSFATLHASQLKPNAVQHNVPGWTMFAIFFIALPLSAGLIRERNEGTLTRLRTLPVSIGIIFLGKIITYTMLSIVQLILMLGIGKFILPLFGTPVLALGQNPELILVVGLCAGLAACGLGIFFGMLAKTYDQVASAGPIVIVIAAAIGGIMIPVFMMPDFIQPLSLFSPLHWGHEAFIDIFLRGSDIQMLLPNLAKLLGFFVMMTIISMWMFKKQQR